VSVYFNDLDHALFFTLCYSDYFSFPLIKDEIFERLPKVWDWALLTGQKLDSDRLPINKNKNQLERSLQNLLDRGKIEKVTSKETEYFFIKGRQKIVNLRIKKKQTSLSRKKVILEASSWLRRFPSIQALALTGSSALDNATIDDDLDFCLIVKENTLWITRFFLILLAKLLNKQPQIDAQAKLSNKQAWCFNLWLDEQSLDLVNRSFSIYQAYELLQMRWLFDKSDCQQKLISKNKQLANLIDLDIKKNFSINADRVLYSHIFWPFNLIFFYLQSLYRYLLFGKENYFLTLNQAHFNESSRQEHIFQIIQRKMKRNAFSNF